MTFMYATPRPEAMRDNPKSRPPLFYCAELPAAGGTALLQGEEARHALAARRLASGDAIALFNGRGTVADGRIARVERKSAALAITIEHMERQAPPRSITLASALPKGDRMAVLLDMGTQLGMTRFVPLQCERSVVKATIKAHTRWERVCLEACKQARRSYVPRIAAAVTPDRIRGAVGDDAEIWVADPAGAPIQELISDSTNEPSLVIMVGPEGGFTATEIDSIVQQGGRRVALGSAILRIETAAVAALAGLLQ